MEGDRGKADAREIQRMQGGDGRRARKWGCEGGSDVCVCVCVRAGCEGANGGRGGDAGCEGGRVLYVCRRDGVIDGEGETVGAREAETYACADARW